MALWLDAPESRGAERRWAFSTIGGATFLFMNSGVPKAFVRSHLGLARAGLRGPLLREPGWWIGANMVFYLRIQSSQRECPGSPRYALAKNSSGFILRYVSLERDLSDCASFRPQSASLNKWQRNLADKGVAGL